MRRLLRAAKSARVLVLGDIMLDQFIWGQVSRISPEAPVPVIEFERESHMPGGAANVARNLSALGAQVEMVGVIGQDPAAEQLQRLLRADHIGCRGVIKVPRRMTTRKIRVIAHQQQVARVDRETRANLSRATMERLVSEVERRLPRMDALIVGDYAKGVVTQWLLERVKPLCRERGIWLSLDPKPAHRLDLSGFSLITPNRKETFELVANSDCPSPGEPLKDEPLLAAVRTLQERFRPALLLVTLGDRGMLLCRHGAPPLHLPTAAQEVFDVSGAGDTVIASFTLAVVAGASPVEATQFSNLAAGVVVGKVGTATVLPNELLASFG